MPFKSQIRTFCVYGWSSCVCMGFLLVLHFPPTVQKRECDEMCLVIDERPAQWPVHVPTFVLCAQRGWNGRYYFDSSTSYNQFHFFTEHFSKQCGEYNVVWWNQTITWIGDSFIHSLLDSDTKIFITVSQNSRTLVCYMLCVLREPIMRTHSIKTQLPLCLQISELLLCK